MKLKEAVYKLNERELAVTKSGKGILGGIASRTFDGITAYDNGFVIEPQGNQWFIVVSQENNFDYEATFDDLAEAVEAVCEKVAVEIAV